MLGNVSNYEQPICNKLAENKSQTKHCHRSSVFMCMMDSSNIETSTDTVETFRKRKLNVCSHHISKSHNVSIFIGHCEATHNCAVEMAQES